MKPWNITAVSMNFYIYKIVIKSNEMVIKLKYCVPTFSSSCRYPATCFARSVFPGWMKIKLFSFPICKMPRLVHVQRNCTFGSMQSNLMYRSADKQCIPTPDDPRKRKTIGCCSCHQPVSFMSIASSKELITVRVDTRAFTWWPLEVAAPSSLCV